MEYAVLGVILGIMFILVGIVLIAAVARSSQISREEEENGEDS